MKNSDPRSPFNWQGKPSIFTTGSRKAAQDFNGINKVRSEIQVRLPPRPTYLSSGSVYLKQPRLSRTLK